MIASALMNWFRWSTKTSNFAIAYQISLKKYTFLQILLVEVKYVLWTIFTLTDRYVAVQRIK